MAALGRGLVGCAWRGHDDGGLVWRAALGVCGIGVDTAPDFMTRD